MAGVNGLQKENNLPLSKLKVVSEVFPLKRAVLKLPRFPEILHFHEELCILTLDDTALLGS